MIARIWDGWTKRADVKAYEKLLRVVPRRFRRLLFPRCPFPQRPQRMARYESRIDRPSDKTIGGPR